MKWMRRCFKTSLSIRLLGVSFASASSAQIPKSRKTKLVLSFLKFSKVVPILMKYH